MLANIYLHELDKFMERYAENLNTEAKRKHFSTAYNINPVLVRHTDIGKRAERYGIVCLRKKRKSDVKILRNWKRLKNLQLPMSITTVIIKGCSTQDMRMILSSE